MNIRTLLSFLLISVLLTSCSDESTTIETPLNYEFTRSGISSVSFSGQTTRIGMATELVKAMSGFNQDATTLTEMFSNQMAAGGDADPYEDPELNASTKSVKSKVAASTDFFATNTAESAEIKADFQTWIDAQVSEVFPNKDNLAQAGSAGQIADGSSVRYVNSKGLEYNQAVNKSLIGALMIDQICNNYLSPAVLDADSNIEDNNNGTVDDGESYTTMEHKWDEAYGYLFGFSADPSDPLMTLGDDSFLNKYLSRVNGDSDFEGIASDIFEAFKLGRAAIVARDYEVRDEQAVILKEKLAMVIAIRAVYYLQNGKVALSNGDMGGAFHDLSEGFGFVYSLRFTREPNSNTSYFTKSEVDGFINQLTEGNGFWDISAATLDQMSEDIAGKFSFTVAQAAQ